MKAAQLSVDFDTLRPVRVVESVTREVFRDTILPGGEPVIMKGLMRDWPLVCTARRSTTEIINLLKSLDVGVPMDVIRGAPQIEGRFFYSEDLSGLNFDRKPERISDALDDLAHTLGQAGAQSVYIQSAPVHRHMPRLVDTHSIDLLPPAIEPRIWIGNQLTVQTHFDLSANIAGVAAGRRRFTLFPPHQTPNLYVGPFELTLAGPPISMVRLEAADTERYPNFSKALEHAVTAELEPGDAIYIPYFWWHHVQSLAPFNVLVNYWWNDAPRDLASPFDALLHAIISLRDLPAEQKAAWQTMFQQYVFGDSDAAVAHLPETVRGALGPHTPDQRRKLKATLAQNLAHQAGLTRRR